MKIYHYLRDFTPEAPRFNSGMEKAVSGLAAGLPAVDSSVESIVLCEGAKPLDIKRLEGYRVICFDNRGLENRKFALAPSLKTFVANEMRDGLVVLNAIFHTSVMLLANACRRAGVPYIVAPHDPYHPAIFSNGRLKKEMYWRFFERPTLRRAAAVQVLDRRHQQFIQSRGVQTPVIEVVNGYVAEEVPEESSLQWRTSGPIRMLFLGRIDRVNKGVDLLIDAFAQIAKSHDAQLTLRGPDQGDGAALEAQIAQAGMSDRIELLGPEYKLKPTELAAQFDLFMLPSRFEGFGLVAMEAMLAARPVLLTDIAGLAPHVRRCEGGVVVDSTVDSIRTGIEQLIARRNDWREIGMRGRRYVLENLNWTHIARGALLEYQQVLARSHPR